MDDRTANNDMVEKFQFILWNSAANISSLEGVAVYLWPFKTPGLLSSAIQYGSDEGWIEPNTVEYSYRSVAPKNVSLGAYGIENNMDYRTCNCLLVAMSVKTSIDPSIHPSSSECLSSVGTVLVL